MKKETRGRKPANNPAEERAYLRCTHDQKKRWSVAAEKSGLSLSSWLKSLADKNA